MPVDVARLRVFHAVVEHGSFSKAALALGYTQPALSHHVAKLEQELGVQLIERTPPRSLRVTAPGRALLRHAEAVLARLDDAEREVHAVAGLKAGSLALSTFPTAAATFVPTAIGVFRRRFPEVAVEISEHEPHSSIPRLAAGEFDLALSYEYPSVATRVDPRIETEVLFSDPMAVLLPSDHPLANEDSVQVGELAEEGWITPHDSGCRNAILQACRSVGFTPRVASQTNDYMAMQGLVAAGVGIALVPWLVAAIRVHPDTVLCPLNDGALIRVVMIATRVEGYRSPGAEILTSIFGDVIDTMSSELPLAIGRQSAAIRPGRRRRVSAAG
jgi:DNA-binding transcriptional LysR family regulator